MKIFQICSLWAIFTAVVFFACGDTVDPSKYGFMRKNVITEGDITNIITDVAFYKVGYNAFPKTKENWLTQLRVDEYSVGDTMAIWFETKVNFKFSFPVARVISHKTDDVQYINFVLDPLPWVLGIDQNIFGYIAYISPVKHKSYSDKLIQDPTRTQLRIDPKEDILTAEIIYNDQILTKTINVRGY
jgi:hypothetical protein